MLASTSASTAAMRDLMPSANQCMQQVKPCRGGRGQKNRVCVLARPGSGGHEMRRARMRRRQPCTTCSPRLQATHSTQAWLNPGFHIRLHREAVLPPSECPKQGIEAARSPLYKPGNQDDLDAIVLCKSLRSSFSAATPDGLCSYE